MKTIDKETGLAVYETPDEIPINERIIPPISIDWFPKHNLISIIYGLRCQKSAIRILNMQCKVVSLYYLQLHVVEFLLDLTGVICSLCSGW